MQLNCPFCQLDRDRIIIETQSFVCFWDEYPVSDGHTLVAPKRHIETWFDATIDEQASLLAGIRQAKIHIETRFQPDGYNIGVNVREAGGQTVDHLHIHVIPRYSGDVRDPRGGVRNVVPSKGNYLALRKDAKDSVGSYTASTSQTLIFGSSDKPLLNALAAGIGEASRVDIAVAFITRSGLNQLGPYLLDLLQRKGEVRILTGDYLDVTEPEALFQLNDWVQEKDLSIQVRVFQTDKKFGFHPKAYLLHNGYAGVTAYVGSSNLTMHALKSGLEWNQLIRGDAYDLAIQAIVSEFNSLFEHPNTVEMTPLWIHDYARRRRVITTSHVVPEIDLDAEVVESAVVPHPIQIEALKALNRSRSQGNHAGLVVMATGLGKTWLAAFDCTEFQSVLFVAHREEILNQAMATFRRIRPASNLGYYKGGQYNQDADVLFASIQTLGRQNHLANFDSKRYDYIVVDEFHHASAVTYRRLIDHFEPKFMLGLTATPERTDGGDLLALCGENLVFRCDLVDGINRGVLSPFQYFGVPDEVDFTNIPWRSGRFDPQQLEYAVATETRAKNALEQWQRRSQTRTLAFCVSMRHADYMAEFFVSNGVKAVSVHSGPSAAPRTQSLKLLESGELQVVFAVDMFNEGVDVPTIDTVMMLRPTESKILWLQQFGRGLRKAENKSHLAVIDYIGNHRSFLQVPAVLLPGAGSKPGEVHSALRKLEMGELELPAGCSVHYELEALNILKQLSKPIGVSEQMAHWYRSFRELNGRRPTAVEAFHEGYGPNNVRTAFGSWVGFVKSEGDLTVSQNKAFDAHRDFIEQLEKTQMTKSFKMVVLQSMIAARKFPGTITIDELISRVRTYASRLSALREDFGNTLTNSVELRRLLEENPIAAWTGGRGTGGKPFFFYERDSFSSFAAEQQYASALRELTQEIADWRVAQYLDRTQPEERIQDKALVNGELSLWNEYMRESIPPLFKLEFNAATWNQGVVRNVGVIILLVSLNKSGLADAHQYADRFLSNTEFQWQSQNQTKQDSKLGKAIRNHEAEGTKIYLFVRDRRKTPKGKAAPFIFCGRVAFISWEGNEPITVRWKLSEALPRGLSERFGL